MKFARILAVAATIATASGYSGSSPASESEGSGLRPSPEVWGVATLASYHAERDRGYNEQNFGLGLEYHINRDWHLAAGIYKNSYYEYTGYFAVGYELFHFWYFRFNIVALGLTGYTEGRVDFLVAPVLSFEYKRFGINVAPITPEVVGLQVKWRFE